MHSGDKLYDLNCCYVNHTRIQPDFYNIDASPAVLGMILAQNFLLKPMNTADGLVLRLTSGNKAGSVPPDLTYACGLAGSVPPYVTNL